MIFSRRATRLEKYSFLLSAKKPFSGALIETAQSQLSRTTSTGKYSQILPPDQHIIAPDLHPSGYQDARRNREAEIDVSFYQCGYGHRTDGNYWITF